MKLGIDASNIKAGGGLVHLKNIVEHQNSNNDFQITVVGGEWLAAIIDGENIVKQIFKKPFSSILQQELFKHFKLPKIMGELDLVFSPGGTFFSRKVPYVSMSQNMLVFEKKERNRFFFSFNWLRYLLLEKLQIRSFKRAEGIIFISHYAKNYVEAKYPFLKNKNSIVIYHGISEEFRNKPKPQFSIEDYSTERPLKLLYVSIINYYKHQWVIIEAVKKIRKEGYHISLDLVGPLYNPVRKKFEKALAGTEDFVHYHGVIDHSEISDFYKRTDIFVFGSTCENMPNILVEAMSAGLPILCSNYGPMPEVLGDAGVYMDPTDVESVYLGIRKLLLNQVLRESIAKKAHQSSQVFSWEKASNDTFEFLKKVNGLIEK